MCNMRPGTDAAAADAKQHEMALLDNERKPWLLLPQSAACYMLKPTLFASNMKLREVMGWLRAERSLVFAMDLAQRPALRRLCCC